MWKPPPSAAILSRMNWSPLRLASALTQKPAPTLRRGPVVQGGANWTDERWLKTQLSTMDLRLESKSLQTHRRRSVGMPGQGPPF